MTTIKTELGTLEVYQTQDGRRGRIVINGDTYLMQLGNRSYWLKRTFEKAVNERGLVADTVVDYHSISGKFLNCYPNKAFSVSTDLEKQLKEFMRDNVKYIQAGITPNLFN